MKDKEVPAVPVIKKAELQSDADDLHRIIQQSFITVAEEMNLSRDKAPTNPAYMERERVVESFEKGLEYYLAIVDGRKAGCIAIERSPDNPQTYFIERLGVLPEYRHRKIGEKLLDHSISEIRRRGGSSAGIAIINENTRLKAWYEKYGFREDRTKVFDHLPFTVCFMSLKISL